MGPSATFDKLQCQQWRCDTEFMALLLFSRSNKKNVASFCRADAQIAANNSKAVAKWF